MSNWLLSADGSVRTRTEYWLVYERPDGEIRTWMPFTGYDVALGAIPDAIRSTPARRWGIRTVKVTQQATEAIRWHEEKKETTS